MASGNYVSKLSEASHVLFEGNLNDPSFRNIAIQRITQLDADSVTIERSGKLEIKIRNGRHCVETEYRCPIFGRQRTIGHPFKDVDTPAVANNSGQTAATNADK